MSIAETGYQHVALDDAGVPHIAGTTMKVIELVLDQFMASDPAPEQIAAFRPIPEAQERLRLLLTRRQEGQLTELEARELEEFAHIEHLMVMIRCR